jgi:glycosyltransferase involved in cell wall biosynthesis
MTPSDARLVFFEKVFLKRLHPDAKLRGVELFNLGLVRDLAAAGQRLFIPAHPSWCRVLAVNDAPSVTIHPVANLGHPVLTALGAAWSVVRASRHSGPFPFLFVANNAEGLAPAIRMMWRTRAFRKLVLFAHKIPSRRFAASVADIPGSIVCVCCAIADAFRQCGVTAGVHVDYGIVNADAFHPWERGHPARESDGGDAAATTWERGHPARGGDGVAAVAATVPLRVCLLGDMASDWKGADTAIAAMSLLPEAYRGRIELHIKAFRDKRDFPADSGIVSHPWSGADEVPDFLRGMDVMLAASRNRESDGRLMETFSQTTVQGMLTGLPVVHTSIPPFMEKFDAGGGIRADTPAEMAAALVRLANDPELRARLGREARATAMARYAWDTGRFIERYLVSAQ